MYQNRNPQNNLPEPLGTIVILINFGLGVYNAFSNQRQERKQAIYDKHQQEIISLLKEAKNNAQSARNFSENQGAAD